MSNKSEKKKGSGIAAGFALLVIGTILLWWNEGNNVRNIKTITQMEKEVVDISSETVNSEYDGKLVATNGKMIVGDEFLNDSEFDVSIKTAHLNRIVEMFQWKEDETTDDEGDTTYSYSRVWSENIESLPHAGSSHQNPSYMPYHSQEYLANDVKVGAYSLSNSQIKVLATNADYTGSIEKSLDGYQKIGIYYTNSSNLDSPQIGDIRISWKYNDWSDASVLAVASGNSFVDFVSDAEVHINRVDEGILTGKQLIKNQENENNALKWILRAVGALMIFLGYLTITGPLSRLTNKIPILGSLVGGTLFVVSLILGIIHSLIVIIIAWFRYRPVLSIVLIVIVIALIVYLKMFAKKKSEEMGDWD